MKKQVMYALLAVLTLSTLPGCGKSKNDGIGVGGGGLIIGGGGSYPQAGNTLKMSNATGRVTGAISLNYGGAGGNLYTRTNGFGDRLDVYIAGSTVWGTGETNVTASATVALAQSTVDAFNYYCGAQPSVVEFYYNQVTAGTPGTIPESVKIWAQMPTGQWCYGIL
jgi:hypothetical protein